MKRFSQQFKKQSESIKMRVSERNELRERLLSYLEYHPLPRVARKSSTHEAYQEKEIASEPFTVFTLNPFYVRTITSICMVCFVVAVPFVAEHAVPGDVLYPVKVQFNEELRSSLALSPYAKVEWETQRLERRIAEARLLAREGKLTEEAETQVAQAVKLHSDAAQREIAELRESNSDEAAIAEIAFASALAVQSEVLEGHIEKDEVEGNGTTTEGRSVVVLAQALADARDSAQAAQQSGVQLSYEKLLGRVELESTRVYELFKSIQENASGEEIADIERRLADIERKIESAISIKNGTVLPSNPEITTIAVSMAGRSNTAEQTVENEVEVEAQVATDTADVVEEISSSTIHVEDETVRSVETEEEIAEASEQEAIRILRSALTDIQKLLNFMTHIDVRQNVSIDNLLPVALTNEEKAEEAMQLFNETKIMQLDVLSRELPDTLHAKILNGQEEVDKKLSLVTYAMAKSQVDTALTLAKEAHAFASDLIVLTESLPRKNDTATGGTLFEEHGTTTEALQE